MPTLRRSASARPSWQSVQVLKPIYIRWVKDEAAGDDDMKVEEEEVSEITRFFLRLHCECLLLTFISPRAALSLTRTSSATRSRRTCSSRVGSGTTSGSLKVKGHPRRLQQ